MRSHPLVPSLLVAAAFALAAFAPGRASAHCQVPCGIYGDDMRFATLAEHFTTIEKAMKQIEALTKAEEPNYNQIVRWVTTKEQHAEEVVTILTEYFLLQRVAVPAEDADAKAKAHYAEMLRLVHGALVRTMKCKQTTDPAHVEAARKYVHDFQHLYGSK